MDILYVIILGIVEGLTEYLPVSSTGHLILTEQLLGMSQSKEALDAFAVCIQGGAILAVLSIYFNRVKSVFLGLLGKDPAGLKLAINLMLGFIPAAVIGLICADSIKAHLFNVWTVSAAWIIGGLGILVYIAWKNKRGEEHQGLNISQLSYKQSLIIGLLQCVAMIPGTSRSFMTMLGGMFVGLSLAAAVEFSFLLGLVTLGAATCYDAYKSGAVMVQEFGATALIVGTIASWLSAWIAVKWMVSYLQHHSFAVFGWYRIGIGLVTVALLILGVIHSQPLH